MLNTYMKYTFFAVLAYLGLTHASAGGTLINSGANGLATIDKTLQGR